MMAGRVAAYGELSIISALLIGGALAILIPAIETEVDDDDIVQTALLTTTKIVAAAVLVLNIVGTTVILLQKYLVLRGLSHNDESVKLVTAGWIYTKKFRDRAVFAISMSLPAMLLSTATFAVSSGDVRIGDWVCGGLLLLGGAACWYCIHSINAGFIKPGKVIKQ